jgi:hypothetical protein
MISPKIPELFLALPKSSKAPFVRGDIKRLTSQEWAVIEKEVLSESGIRSNQQCAVKSVTNQMKEKTGEMPTLVAAASELGSRGNQGALEATVRSGLPREVAPRFNGKRVYDGRTDAILRAGITLGEAAGELSRRANDNKRIGTRDCATENCQNTIKHADRLWDLCHKRVPEKFNAEFCIGVSGRVCGREIELVNQCKKCYRHPDAKKMREAKKAEKSKCRINGCGGNEFRSYGLC